jgi:hypothetical protein
MAFKSVCTSAVVASPEPLPTSPTASIMRIQENIEEGHNDPEPADERNPNGILL